VSSKKRSTSTKHTIIGRHDIEEIFKKKVE